MIDESLLRDLLAFMGQVEHDLASAHAELMKAQGADPAKFTWPEWSPQANTLRWIPKLRARLAAEATGDDAPLPYRCKECEFATSLIDRADDHTRQTGHDVSWPEPARRHASEGAKNG